MSLIRIVPTAVMLLASPLVCEAQLQVGGDLLDNCAQIDALQKAGKYSEAREKAHLCLDGLEQKLVGQVGQYFSAKIGEWNRTSYEENQVLGFNNISAVYQKGGVTVDVSLTGEAGGGGRGALGGLGGLIGGLAQQAITQTGKQVTVAGLRSSVQPDGTLTVPLAQGSFLIFKSPQLTNADAALSGMGDLVNDFPVADINAALK